MPLKSFQAIANIANDNYAQIVVETSCFIYKIKCQEITHVEASGSYSLIYTLLQEKPFLISKSDYFGQSVHCIRSIVYNSFGD